MSLDTHPDPKLATVPTAHPFQRLSHRPHARRCNWSRAVAHRSRAPALSAGSRGPGGRSAPFVARVALGVLALPDYRRPVASAGAGVVALGLRALSSAVQLHREDGGSAAERAGPTSRSSSPLGVLALPRHSPARPARRMRLRSRRAPPASPPASPRPPPGARARVRGAAACTDAMSDLPSTGA